MAAHRKPRQRTLTGQAGRTAATLALAGAATATAFDGPAHAEPQLTPAQVKAKVDALYEQAESATEQYNGTKVKADKTRTALTRLRDEATRRTERLNSSRNALGSIASAQYRAGGLDPAVQLALSSSPEEYLEGASLAERAGSRQAARITAIRKELARIAELRVRADGRLTELKASQSELARHKSAVQEKIGSAQRLLDRLTAPQRAQYDRQQDGGAQGAASMAGGAVRAPNARAAAAVAYAYGALGKPYVWGATGPGAFDCSGLSQAAWRSAGVSLPRTTYTQINTGQRVSRGDLAPGDLVFFFSGISHVGIYVGGGQMIHAPRPGSAVRLAPIDQMPFAGASRPV
ncbi:NlpC/P60 family protein [Streptomyces scopuliridis]|uniref:NlpC/P60 family protein n=1 Tax=Streptomyces scopuliridis TaxID=452529 RepID=A0ACD4ZIP9_9ACTN|nr:NlpC/P60 family protein [Streptomyces scopuliridis]WSB33968.1 NlpC/P60 family protein [Streptomyces scopuliridis]WSB98249.1 NlpC/P60 family protein [Streptomyces scopuliridis]WSC08049.1 NlpC/P60 family protein [Streptomyces scopuliridis]